MQRMLWNTECSTYPNSVTYIKYLSKIARLIHGSGIMDGMGAEKTENKADCLFVQALASFLLSGRDRAVIFFFISV